MKPTASIADIERIMTDQYTKAKFWKCALQVNLAHHFIAKPLALTTLPAKDK